MVNETYAKSYEADFTLEDTEELLDEGDTSANADKKDEAQETKDKKFSFSEFLNNAKDKVDDAIDAVGEVATEKLSAFEDGLNRIIEGVAVLLVTTCAIPVLVGKIMPILVNFTVPLVWGNLFQLTYNAVDSIIVGHFVGKEALATVFTDYFSGINVHLFV